jgi:hypothetical protein
MEMQLMAWLAAALVFLSFFMKTIVPLRTLAIASNVALLPLNVYRLRQVSATVRNVREAAMSGYISELTSGSRLQIPAGK